MYRTFSARNFRCFEDLTVGPLERINLITGKNNVGKTALLEALWIHHGYHNPTIGTKVDSFRGIDKFKQEEFLRDLFRDFDKSVPILLARTDVNGTTRELRITTREAPTTPLAVDSDSIPIEPPQTTPDSVARETTSSALWEIVFELLSPSSEVRRAVASFDGRELKFVHMPGVQEPQGIFLAARGSQPMNVLAERLSNLAVTKKDHDVTGVLRLIEPRLRGLTVQQRAGGAMICADIGEKRLMALPLMGDGTVRVLGIALAIPEAEGGIVLIDEIENGLHYSVLESVWATLDKLSKKYHTQLFATTHSWECIRAAHRAFSRTDEYPFRFHRLEAQEGTTVAVTYDREMLDTVTKTDLEAR